MQQYIVLSLTVCVLFPLGCVFHYSLSLNVLLVGSDVTSQSDGQVSTPLVGGVLGGVVLLLIALLLVAFSLIVCCWMHGKKSGKLKTLSMHSISI